MESNEGQIKRIVLKRMGRCRTCHRVYTDNDVSVISRKPDIWMMVVECMDCHGKNFVAAVLNEGDPAQAEIALRRLSAGLEGDLLTEGIELEVASVREVEEPKELVNAGDVADMHSFLKDFDGDFIRAFRGSKETRGRGSVAG